MYQLTAQPAAGITLHQDDDPVALSFSGPLDEAGALAFADALLSAEALSPEVLLLDCSLVTAFGPTALRALIGAANRAWCAGREVVLVPPAGVAMWRVLAGLGPDQIRGLVIEPAAGSAS
jgi:anti-anti-sigma regulatory factor